jgi:alkanesulfonate monooxygenase SsuD/methylene tetrahydromethanopterin reductase-like flavin-dependent oxidoreductase (luciferase family)
MQFGVMAGQYAIWDALKKMSMWDVLVRRWQSVEDLGFDSVWLADMYVIPDAPTIPWFEGWTALAALATQTRSIRIGMGVSPIFMHNPAILARMALTVDHVSNGRLILGLGTGVPGKPDHAMTGIPDWSARERVDRFGEFVSIVDLLLRQDISSYTGRFYTIQDASVTPPTVQRPRPPLMIAAMGPRMLRHAAQYADVWNTMVSSRALGDMSLDERLTAVRRQINRLDDYCRELGRDPRSIRRSLILIGAYDNQWRIDYYTSVDAFEEVVTQYQALGIDECIIYYPVNDDQLPAFQQIARDVIPKLKPKR